MDGIISQILRAALNSVVNDYGTKAETLQLKAKSSRPTISVVIPTLNEAANLPLVLPYIPGDWVDEVILVDGRSQDDTVSVAKSLLSSVNIVMEQRPGKGIAMRSGYEAANGDIVVLMDADGSHDPREIPRFVAPLLEGADMVKGSRFAWGGGTTDMPNFRKLGNRALVAVSNLLFGTKFSDLCYGYHAFWKHCLETLDLTNNDGFEIDTALYLQAVRKKLKVVEVPSFEGSRFHGVGKLQTIPDGWRVLKTIMKEYGSIYWDTESSHPSIGFRGTKPLKQQADISQAGSEPSLSNNGTNEKFFSFMGLAVMTGISLQELLRRALQLTLRAVQATSGSIFVLDEEGDVRDAYLAFGTKVWPSEVPDISQLLRGGIAGWVVENRQPAFISNTSQDPRWQRRSWDGLNGNSRSAMVVPLMFDDRVVGVLTLARSHSVHFTDADLDRLRDIQISA